MSQSLYHRKARSIPQGSPDEQSTTNKQWKAQHSQLYMNRGFFIRWSRNVAMLSVFCIIATKAFLWTKGTSNFILWDRVDLSPFLLWKHCPQLTHDHDFYYFLDVKTIQYETRHCAFDLCNVRHEGGEGRLYSGICTLTEGAAATINENKMSVLLKSQKQLWNLHINSQESRAMKLLQGTPLQLIFSGTNFLIQTDLQGYQPILFNGKNLFSGDFLRAYLDQVLRQLSQLHDGKYLHMDVWRKNILYHKSKNQTSFQLIDFGSSMPIQNGPNAIQLAFSTKPHINKLPALACLLPQRLNLLSGVSEYCRQNATSTATARLCYRMVDTFSVGMQVLRILRDQQRGVFGRLDSLTVGFTFSDVVRVYEQAMKILHRLEEKSRETEYGSVLSTVAQLIDLERLNATLIGC